MHTFNLAYAWCKEIRQFKSKTSTLEVIDEYYKHKMLLNRDITKPLDILDENDFAFFLNRKMAVETKQDENDVL